MPAGQGVGGDLLLLVLPRGGLRAAPRRFGGSDGELGNNTLLHTSLPHTLAKKQSQKTNTPKPKLTEKTNEKSR